MLIKTNEINSMMLFQHLSTSIMPRPIAWVSSMSSEGVPNLAPYSLFGILSVTPAVISICVMNQMGGKKDTLVNILDTKVFAISMVSRELLTSMAPTGMPSPPYVNEYETAGVTPEECDTIPCVRCAESKISLECRLREVQNFGDDGDESDSVIIADVLAIHIDDSIMTGQQIDIAKLDNIGHIIQHMYIGTSDILGPMG